MSQDIESTLPTLPLPTPVLVTPAKPRSSLQIAKQKDPLVNVDTPTNTLELYKKYLSCLCAVSITCIVLTISLFIHLLRDTSSDSFQVLRSQVLDVKNGDLSSCYTHDRYSTEKTNKSAEPAVFLTKMIEEGDFLEAQRLSKVKGVLVDVPSYSGYLTVNKK